MSRRTCARPQKNIVGNRRIALNVELLVRFIPGPQIALSTFLDCLEEQLGQRVEGRSVCLGEGSDRKQGDGHECLEPARSCVLSMMGRALLSCDSPIAKVTLQKGNQIEEAIVYDETYRFKVTMCLRVTASLTPGQTAT